MNDEFSYENLGKCYWNGSMGPFIVGIIGSGPAFKVLLDIIYNEAFREFLPDMRLAAVSGLDPGRADAGLVEPGCPLYDSWREMLEKHPEINLVVELTCDERVLQEVRAALPETVSLMDHREVVFFCGMHDMALVKGNFLSQVDHQRTLIQSIIDEIREDIFLLDKAGNVVDVNRIVWQRAGVSRKSLLGKPCWHGARLRDGSVFCSHLDPVCPFHKTLRSGEKEETLVTRVNGSGLLQYYRLYAYPIFDMRGHMTHVMVMHRDITERTHREKYQQQRDKFAIIGEMSTYLAHEIRNPLFAVGGFANSLLKSSNLGEKEREKVQIIASETMRLDRMLTNMLNFARPSHAPAGRVDILAVCSDAAELMDIGYGKQGYRVEVLSPAVPLPTVQGDQDAIKQCLVNLIKNAIEAMPEGGSITLELAMEQAMVVIRVRDSGIGMSEHELDQVFNPFYSTKEDGSGLGLAMIKKIVEECGGHVELASVPKQGTTVSLFFCPSLDIPDGGSKSAGM
ncbi:ATP-binding protein [Pseudodesulfovibrio sp.]|uniref:ATP-binding protein n=1 Tax=unclassified Pseudodesulfovibrio TaxID=2661612 RepID=UPI003B0074F8